MSRYLNFAVFLAGLAAVCWIGVGYAGSNTLALAVTMLIGACYVAGALELRRYHQATSTLAQAIDGLSEPPASLDAWLALLPASLRNAARLRIEGERVGLPGPSLTPYLVGLLVLLGMLGTFLGMVATLKGTGMALESATDLQAIRASLAAPVKGLGFAFGTSVAGVATSAMLGLLSTLCRRERTQAAQRLDARIATTLRIYSLPHQREETFKLLQRQAEVMPTLVDRLQAMMAAMEQQSLALHERQLASQDAFHGKAEAAYTRLASSVEQSLKESVADSARAAGAALQPAVEATMASLARGTAALQDTVTQAVQRQLDGLSTGFAATTTTVAGIWNDALAGHQRSSEALTQDLRTSLSRFTDTFEQRSAGLLEGVSTRLEATTGSLSAAWNNALSQHERVSQKMAGDNQLALAAAAASLEQQSTALVHTVGQSHADLQAELAARDQQRLAAWAETLGTLAATLRKEWELTGAHTASRQQEICDTLAQSVRDISAQTQAHASNTLVEIDRLVQAASAAPKLLESVSARLETATSGMSEAWNNALSQHERVSEKLAGDNQHALAAAAATFEQHAASLVRTVGQSHADLQAELAARDQLRLAAWTDTLGTMAATLRQEWEQAGTHNASRQQQVCDTLAQTARDISAQTQAHASNTVAEIDRLVQAASAAPKLLESVSARLESATSGMSQAWNNALSQHERVSEKLAGDNQHALAAAAATFEQHSASLVRTVGQSHADLQAELAARDQQRLAAWTDTLGAMAATLRQEWEQAGTHNVSRQQEVCDTLAQTARDISAQTQAHASNTIAEIAQLVQAASEAPKAAADVIGELRQKLSDSMVRDNAMLEERGRLLQTLQTLLDAVNHASTEQRTAVDALVGTTADLLDRVGTRFTDKVEAEAGKLEAVAAQVTGSAVEVASLGEAFGMAVQLFGESNDKLVAHLQRIEAALDKSVARSDEQLAYYVAQAREVIDLSMLSQKQIVENLQHLAGQRAPASAEAA
ncbi:DUF802 domain-containing protein [Cupriavidus basilensis]|uniref:Methyl-accepting chemotaxis protein n=1 Tax=Cupriavidus basilensis TaxID=68895 RepID=A0A0C4YKT1_9BURK|nr:DUF802 domain-containing protein [Cupriavidus basilensis]AJG22604.1 Methyl-accepting chemotaxis protein [Cupriavidus basilensis]